MKICKFRSEKLVWSMKVINVTVIHDYSYSVVLPPPFLHYVNLAGNNCFVIRCIIQERFPEG